MFEGRDRQLWNHTSSIVAYYVNCHRDPKKKAFNASDFNPYETRSAAGNKVAANRANIMAMKPAFLAMKK